MKRHSPRRPRPEHFLALSLLATPLFAQTAPPAKLAAGNRSVDEKAVVLEPFDVTAKRTTGYGVSSSTTATRLNTSLREIPQTINVITSEFIEELGAASFGEAVAYTTNVSERANVPDGYVIRGFGAFGSRFYNGWRLPLGGVQQDHFAIDRIEVLKGPGSAVTGRGDVGGVVNSITKQPLAAPGGSLAFTYDDWKSYRFVFDQHGSMLSAMQGAYRVLAMWQDRGTFRLKGDFTRDKRRGVAPSVRIKPFAGTTLNFEANLQQGKTPGGDNNTMLVALDDITFQDLDGVLWQRDAAGNLAFNAAGNVVRAPAWAGVTLAQSRNIGRRTRAYPSAYNIDSREPWSGRDYNVNWVSTTLRQRISDTLDFRQGLLWQKNDNVNSESTFGSQPNSPTHVEAQTPRALGFVRDFYSPANIHRRESNRRYRNLVSDGETVALQGDLLYALDLRFAGKHQLLGGYEWNWSVNRTRENSAGMAAIKTHRTTIERTADIPPQSAWILQTHNRTETTNVGYYLQDAVSLLPGNRLKLLAGIRWDDQEQDFRNRINAAGNQLRTPASTKSIRYGASYDVFKWLTPYIGYSDQKEPTNTQLRYPNPLYYFTPEQRIQTISSARTGELKEIGLKSELFGGRITVNFALFELAQTGNIRNITLTAPDPNTGLLTSYAENQVDPGDRTKGGELEIFGSITPRWGVYFSGSMTSSESKQTGDTVRYELREVRSPQYAARTRYEVWRDGARSFSVNTGVAYVGPGIRAPREYIRDPDSLRWDLGAVYGHGTWSVRLTGINVTDEFIISGPEGGLGSPRRWQMDLTKRW